VDVFVQFSGLPLQFINTITYPAHLGDDFRGWRLPGLPNPAADIVTLGAQLVGLGDGLPMPGVQVQELRNRVVLAPVSQGFSNQVRFPAY
jgi:hypothetical protein